MFPKTTYFSESFLTEGAGKGSLFCVASVVSDQLALGGKSLLTLAALQLVVLFLLVDEQLVGAGECLTTHYAGVGLKRICGICVIEA